MNREAATPEKERTAARAAMKLNTYMALGMGTMNSVALSLVGTLVSGHFTWGSWASGLAIGWVIGMLIAFFVPIKKLSDAACERCGVTGKKIGTRIVSGVTASLLMTPVMSLVMGVVMMNITAHGLDRSADALNAELDSTKAQIVELTGKLEGVGDQIAAAEAEGQPEKAESLRAAQGEIQGGIAALTKAAEGQLDGVEAQRSAAREIREGMLSSILWSELFTNIAGIIVNILFQPMILAFAMKHSFGKLGGRPAGAPPPQDTV